MCVAGPSTSASETDALAARVRATRRHRYDARGKLVEPTELDAAGHAVKKRRTERRRSEPASRARDATSSSDITRRSPGPSTISRSPLSEHHLTLLTECERLLRRRGFTTLLRVWVCAC